mmetsp:Transcript_9374/g.26896  ORF Transcript_9374/g.26896 Transcript_9374/m.26896 type:complete len:89 (-) Transcript_9374:111-377(-)
MASLPLPKPAGPSSPLLRHDLALPAFSNFVAPLPRGLPPFRAPRPLHGHRAGASSHDELPDWDGPTPTWQEADPFHWGGVSQQQHTKP